MPEHIRLTLHIKVWSEKDIIRSHTQNSGSLKFRPNVAVETHIERVEALQAVGKRFNNYLISRKRKASCESAQS